MGLYDGYKLNNSTYISQYVGSLVPELKDFSAVMQKRYNEAKDTDDALVEAMGNLQHLGTEEDTTYANELKQNYMTRLMERSEREDYENMGRRTQRDARQFSSDYVPLVNRMKGMQTIQERVLQDEKIAAPETKQKILGRIQHMNKTARDPETGDFVRDASGKVKLGAIQDWAYAKDVDINKKLADFLKAKETDISQSGFGSNGQGLMTSVKRETRSPVEIARMAKEMMETDPEIKAMIERDVELSTYAYTPGQVAEIANKNNVSLYDRLKRDGLSDSMIKANLKANGRTLEEAKSKPIDALRQRFIANGRSAEEADRAFLREETRKGLMSPHIDLVSRLLKVDRQTLEAREDPNFLVKALGSMMASMLPDNSGDAMPMVVTTDNGEQQIDVTNLHNNSVVASQESQKMKSTLQATVGNILGMPTPKGKNTPDWYNKTGRYVNDKGAQGELIQKLAAAGRHQDAANLTQAFKQYNEVNNRAIYAKQAVDNVAKSVDLKPLYTEYLKDKSNAKKLSYEEFKKSMTDAKVVNRKFMGSSDFVREDETFIKRLTGDADPMDIRIARNKYFETLQSKAQANGKTGQISNMVFEPTTSGWIKTQTESIEAGLKSFQIPAKDMATGETLEEILTKELGSGMFSTSVSDGDKMDPNSDYNKALRLFQARINIDTRGANGEPTATITTPKGAKRTVVLSTISPTLPIEMSARMMGAAGKYMTRGESTHHTQSAITGAGRSQLKNINQVDLYSLTPAAKPYQINDMFYLKVGEAGIKGAGNKTNVYTLMVKQGDKYVATQVANRTRIEDIVQAIGGIEMRDQMTTIPSVGLLDR